MDRLGGGIGARHRVAPAAPSPAHARRVRPPVGRGGADGGSTTGPGPGPAPEARAALGEGQRVATVRGTDPGSRRVAQRMRTRSRMHHHPGSTSPLAKLSRLEVAAA